MNVHLYRVLCLCLFLGCSSDSALEDSGELALNESSDSFGVMDVSGKRVDPFIGLTEKAVVFLFVSIDCPISNRYAPTVRKLAEKYSEMGIRFRLVYPDPDTTPEEIKKHIEEYDYPIEALRDPQHSLAELGKARVTPDVAVFTSSQNLVYHGRIDNRFIDFGKERPAATKHDLEEVLSAVSEGKPVSTESSPGVGCYIADLR